MSEETRDPTDAELALASCVLWYADQASQNDTWWANDPDLQLARDILGVPASGRVTHQHLWARDDVLKVATAAHLDGRTRYIISANGIIAERYLAVMDSGSLSVEDKRGPVTEPGAVARVRAAIERYEGDQAATSGERHYATTLRITTARTYAIRPSRRGQGHEGALLSAMVPIAWFQGIDPVILHCDDGDIAARQAIDAYGGTMQHPQGNRRYLIPAQDLLRTS